MFETALNIMVLISLVVMIAFCWRLNNKFVELKYSRADLLQLLKIFDEAIIKTYKNVSDLKSMTTSSAQEFQVYLSKANEMIGDLSFMTETATKLANRLEDDIANLRQAPINSQQFEEINTAIDNSDEVVLVDNRSELLAAIKNARMGS